MKKTLFIFAVLLLTACSKNDPEVSIYTTSQQKAFAIFNGTFADIQFSNLSGGSLAQYLPDPEKLYLVPTTRLLYLITKMII